MCSCVDHRGRCARVCLWRRNEIRYVKGTGSWLWSLWRINVPGELSASTGGAVDVLTKAAVLQLNGNESKGITPTIVLPITANYWSVTQLDEWLIAFQRHVEGFTYKQHIATNHCSPHLCSQSGLKAARPWSNTIHSISVFIGTFKIVSILRYCCMV